MKSYQRRQVSRLERVRLFHHYKGLCGMCGEPLNPVDFHIDHITPYKKTGLSLVHDCQPVHPQCNWRKSIMSLRKHQRQVQEATRLSIEEGMEPLICDIAPGGGKSLLPMIVQHEMRKAGKNYKLAWIVPRDNLRQQGEQAYSEEDDAYCSRRLLGHELSVMAVTGPEINPSKGLDGFVTTYDTIASAADSYWQEFKMHDYILVLDEVHHVAMDDKEEEQRQYYRSLKPLWDLAKFRVLMTGTLSRADGKKIAFVPYKPTGLNARGCEIRQVDRDDPGFRFITYTREDALNEHAIIKLEARHHDGPVSWSENGEVTSIGSLSSAKAEDVRKAIGAALSTELALKILDRAVNNWISYKRTRKWSKLLVVAPDQKSARQYQRHIELEHGIVAGLAITDEVDASGAIRKFKGKKGEPNPIDVLVTVGMAYEGLDVPAITHIAALTRIRSTEWLDQMTARATRYFHKGGPWGSQTAFIFAPDDALMNRFFDAYMQQQEGLSVEDQDEPKPGGEGGPSDVIPLRSALDRFRATHVDGANAISASETSLLEELQEKYGQTGSILEFRQLLIDIGIYEQVVKDRCDEPPSAPTENLEEILKLKLKGKTPSEQSKWLRTQIGKIGNRRAFNMGVENSEYMSAFYQEIKFKFGRSVTALDLNQLKRAWLWLMGDEEVAKAV